MTVKSSVSLTDEQYAFAKAMVDAGKYPSVSAVLQQGVEILRERVEDAELDRAALRQLLEDRSRSDTVSKAEFDRRIEAMMDAKRAGYGLEP